MTDRAQPNVLIVNGDPEVSRTLLAALAGRAVHGTVCRDVPAALDLTVSNDWHLVFADLDAAGEQLPRLLQQTRADRPEMPVILISRRDSLEPAVRAVRAGCHDVLVKPIRPERLSELLATLLPGKDVPVAAAAEQGSRRLFHIVGRSDALRQVIGLCERVAPTSLPVLVTGESGTGKELISYLIHYRSSRCEGPFIRVNCAALSESLLESELFGHERGAFTGAYARRKGRFERAHGGTLLLDEISETTPRLQAELLRVLETQDFERVGGSEPVRVNVRVISTTNRDLARDVHRGAFRRDLYYRLRGMQVTVPPLRQRPEDVPLLAWHFINEFAAEARRRIESICPELLETLVAYPWPGNVRQLRNVVRTALLLSDGAVLSLPCAAGLRRQLMPPEPPPATLRLRELERRAVCEALRRTNRHCARAAELLGISDRTLREKIRRYRRDGHWAEDETWVRTTA